MLKAMMSGLSHFYHLSIFERKRSKDDCSERDNLNHSLQAAVTFSSMQKERVQPFCCEYYVSLGTWNDSPLHGLIFD